MNKRRHRINDNDPGHAHQLNFGCDHNFPFLKAERTCEWLRDAIDEARQKLNFALWGYVFMPEHVHLIVCPRDAEYDVAAIRKAIKAPVGRLAIAYLKKHAPEWLPRLTRVRGQKTEHLFWQSGGGFDHNITEGKTLLVEIDYLHMNPVRRNLCQRTTDWKWSSAGWYAGDQTGPLQIDPIPPEWLFDCK